MAPRAQLATGRCRSRLPSRPGSPRTGWQRHASPATSSGPRGRGVAAIRHVTKRADDAWQAVNDRLHADAEKRGERVDSALLLERITLHEARHTYASLMIAAGVNAKALSTYMGHANISITLDRYGHLMPGNEAQAAKLLDAYLDAATL